jgi:hypothetical protein
MIVAHSRRPSRPVFLFAKVLGLLTAAYIVSYSLFQRPSHIHKWSRLSNASWESVGMKFGAVDTYEDDENSYDTPWTIPYSTASTHDLKIANSTLGFQSIMVLGLRDRLLKRDSMELAASITNLNLTWIDGVLGGEMHSSSVPSSHNEPGPGIFKKDEEVGEAFFLLELLFFFH